MSVKSREEREREVREQYDEITDKLFSDRSALKDFLSFSGTHYKLPSEHTMMIFLSNPNAKMVTDYDTWQKLGRQVKHGKNSIAAFENGRLKHYFDISQTYGKNVKSRWLIDITNAKKLLEQISARETRDFGSLTNCIDFLSDRQSGANFAALAETLNIPAEQRRGFYNSARTMVRAVVAARCCYLSKFNYKSADALDLSAVDMLKNKAELEKLLEYVQKNAKAVLLSIEKDITEIQRRAIYERGNQADLVRGGQDVLPRNQGGERQEVSARPADVRVSGGAVAGSDGRGAGADEQADRLLRQEVAGVYGGELSSGHSGAEGQNVVGADTEADRQGSRGNGVELGTGIREEQSPTAHVSRNSAVGEDEVARSQSQSDDGNRPQTARINNSAEADKAPADFVSEKSFAEQVDEVLNGTASRYNDLKVCDTPQILLDVGCEQLPMLYTQKHLKKAIQTKDLKEHTHGLDLKQIKALPSLIENPAMILDSTSRTDSILLVLPQVDKEKCPLVVTVKPNGNGKYNLDVIASNFITSIYGRENFSKFIERNIEMNNVLYCDKEKSQELFRVLGLQFPKGVNSLDFNIIIHQSRNIVKGFEEKISEDRQNFEQITLDSAPERATYSTNPAKPQEKHDFRITEDTELGAGGLKTKFRDNIAAIETLKKIERENRLATPDEQQILAKYVGWGGLSQAFDSGNGAWTNEYKQLRALLTDDEYKAAAESTLNAHYTSPEVIGAMYKALDNFGFESGNVLEPSMGVGNFFGCLPEKMRGSKLYGVELDDITGRIAKQLYQTADIQINGFEKTDFPDNFFDAAIGNVPFGNYGISDARYNKENFLVHDYFFAKTLDKVAPGGVVAFITSKGTLDKANPKVREYLAKRADLIGAIRLPNNAFKGANTEVTSDIIFLQKREKMAVELPDWCYTAKNSDGITVNQYFIDNPEMVLGKLEFLRDSSDRKSPVRLSRTNSFPSSLTAPFQAFASAEDIKDLETRLRLSPTYIGSIKFEISEEQLKLNKISELIRMYEKIIEGNYIDNLIAAEREKSANKSREQKH